MAILDDMTEQEVGKNKAIRGYIVRALAKGNQNALARTAGHERASSPTA